MRLLLRKSRRKITVVAAGLLAAFGLAVAGGAGAVPAVAATSSCAAAYSVPSDWGSGFTANLNVTDNGTGAITGWTVTYTYAGNQTLANGWNGNWTQSGKTVTVTNESYNGSLAAGASTSAGANFNYSGTNAAPTSVTCTPAGGTTPPPAGSITATPTSLNVTQGSTGTFTLELSSAPASNVTVSLTASGNTGLTASPTSLTFTPSNYATAQTVTVTANTTGTGTTTFTASASGYTATTITATEITRATGSAPQLHVSGNKLVDANGNTVVLHGVDRSGTEYECVQGNGIFDGPNDQASITAIKSWGPVNAVRVPLNEACWNAESYVNSAYAGANYINAIKSYVSLLNSNGIVAILDLHWTDGAYTGPSSGCSSAEASLPEADAGRGAGDPVLDVGGEHLQGQQRGHLRPVQRAYVPGAANSGDGRGLAVLAERRHPAPGSATGGRHAADGQRGPLHRREQRAHARRRGVLQRPDRLAAATSPPTRTTTWSRPGTPTTSTRAARSRAGRRRWLRSPRRFRWSPARSARTTAPERYITPLTTWLESKGISFLAWAWNADFACSSGPGLITDYTGTPTAYGAAYKAILQALLPAEAAATRRPPRLARPGGTRLAGPSHFRMRTNDDPVTTPSAGCRPLRRAPRTQPGR